MSTSLQLGSEQASDPTERENIKDLKRNVTDMTKENACLALPCQTYMYEGTLHSGLLVCHW